MRVSLAPANLRFAHKLAKQRNNKPQLVNRRFDQQHDDYTIHLMSAIAEVAWSLLTGWPVDCTTRLGDGGIDFSYAGRTYQIKARDVRRRTAPDLLCRPSHAHADRFVLAEVNVDQPDTVNFVGWCTREELTQHTVSIRGKGLRHIAYRSTLRPIPLHVTI